MARKEELQHCVLLSIRQIDKEFGLDEKAKDRAELLKKSDGRRTFESVPEFFTTPMVIFDIIKNSTKLLEERRSAFDTKKIPVDQAKLLAHQIEQHFSALMIFIAVVNMYLDEFLVVQLNPHEQMLYYSLVFARNGAEVATISYFLAGGAKDIRRYIADHR